MEAAQRNEVLIDDEVMLAELQEQGWVFVYWKTNENGRLPKTLIRDLRVLEEKIRQEKLTGWICNSEREHVDMHTIIRKLGGRQYGGDEKLLFFKKEIKHVL